MKNLLSKTGSLVVGSLCVAGALPASASTLYDNVSAPGSQFNSTITMGQVGTELADQFIMADSPVGNYYDLTSLTLKLYGNFTGTAQAKVSIYANDGSLWNPNDSNSKAPSSTLWSSGWFSFDSTAFSGNQADLAFNATDLQYAPVLPKSFTIGLQFQVTAGDENNIGVFSFSPSGMTGNSFDDYWARDNADGVTPGAWQLHSVSANNTLVPIAFGATIEGNAQVPEPSAMALLGLGGLGLMALAKRSRRQE